MYHPHHYFMCLAADRTQSLVYIKQLLCHHATPQPKIVQPLFFFYVYGVLPPGAACSVFGGQKRALDPQKQELHTAFSFQVGAGN